MSKTALIWLVLILGIVVLYTMMRGQTKNDAPSQIGMGEIVAMAKGGKIKQAHIKGPHVLIESTEGKKYSSYVSKQDEMIKAFLENKVKYSEVPDDSGGSIWTTLLISMLPMLLIVFLFIWMMRGMAGGQMSKMDKFRSSNATKVEKETTTFADVAGIDEAKEEVQDFVEYLKDPKQFTRLGARMPKGVLLVGEPGTGKTLLARAVAGEAGVPFFSAAASGFIEMFVGVGAARVRELFEQGKKHAPCIIFIDEIDAVGQARGGMKSGGGHEEREQTLNELFVQMDGLEQNQGVIVMAATNRPDVLDSALRRAGRFDREVEVPKPDVKGREEILKVHVRLKKVRLAEMVDLSKVAKRTPGMNGAQLESMVNEAAFHAAKLKKDSVDDSDFIYAADKVILGKERKMVMTPEDVRQTAYHEAGHALVNWLTPGCDPLRKVTVIPRNRSLGLMLALPDRDRHTYNERDLRNMIKVAQGGQIAEELVLNFTTTGIVGDLQRATNIAKAMVCDYGMVKSLPNRTFGETERMAFLNYGKTQDYSEETARQIDAEIGRILAECYAEAKALIVANTGKLQILATALQESETLETEQVAAIIGPPAERST
jgi:cell division protease FtsH